MEPGHLLHAALTRPSSADARRLIASDPAINDALRTVTGRIHPTSADNLPILAGIQPAELRRERATLSLACRAM